MKKVSVFINALIFVLTVAAALAVDAPKAPEKVVDTEKKVITAPPKVVIPMQTLNSKYGWVGGQFTLSQVTKNSSMVRERRGDRAVFILHGIVLGHLAVDGECFWDTKGFHLLKGRAYLFTGSTTEKANKK